MAGALLHGRATRFSITQTIGSWTLRIPLDKAHIVQDSTAPCEDPEPKGQHFSLPCQIFALCFSA